MSRILNFKDNPVEILTLPELKLSVDETATNGRPFNGITHYELFEELGNIATRHNEKFEYGNLYVTDSKNKIQPGVSIMPHLENVHGKNALEASLLRRVVGSMTFSNYENDHSISSIGINFHQRGIELAYGNNVKVCSNLHIYGGTLIMSYGAKGMPLNSMFDVFENWIQKLSDFRNSDTTIIDRMQNNILPISGSSEAISGLVGKLCISAVKRAYIDSTFDAPLNISQCSTFTRDVLKTYGDNPKTEISVYDLQNIASNILKPGQMNSEELLKQSNSLGSFFMNEYQIQKESY